MFEENISQAEDFIYTLSILLIIVSKKGLALSDKSRYTFGGAQMVDFP
jgi:hypothetical protein